MAQPYTELNPPVDSGATTTPSTINQSRGFDPNLSKAGAIKTSGDALDMGIKTADQFVRDTIKDTAYKEIDAVRDEYGARDSALNQRRFDNESAIPSGLGIAGKNLDDLQRGYQQGTIKYSQYLARLDSAARQLRAQYPGYRDYIDNTISNITGFTPANRLVTQLEEEAKKLGHATEEEKFQRQYLKENEAHLPPNYYSSVKNGTRYNFLDIQQYVANDKRTKADMDKMKANISIEKEGTDLYTQKLNRLAVFDINNSIGKALEPVTKQLGDIQLKAQEEEKRTGAVSPGTEAEVRRSIGLVKEATSKIVESKLNSQDYRLLSTDAREKIRKDASNIISGLEDSYTNKDWGTLTARLHAVKASTESADMAALSDTGISILGAVNRQAGPQVANTLAIRLAPDLASASTLHRLTSQIEANKLTLGMSNPSKTLDKLADVGANPNITRVTVQAPIDLILNSNVTPTVKTKIIDSYYGPNSNPDDILNKAKTSQDRRALFDIFTKPEITKEIVNQAKQSGNPEVLNKYTTWTNKAFAGTFFKELADLDSIMTSPNVEVKYNPTTNQFVATPKDMSGLRGLENTPAKIALDASQRISNLLNGDRLSGINQAIKNMLPVWKEQGLDPITQVGQIVSSHHSIIEPSASGFETVLNKVTKGYNDVIKNLAPKTQGKVDLNSNILDIPIPTNEDSVPLTREQQIQRFIDLSGEMDKIYKSMSNDLEFKKRYGEDFGKYLQKYNKENK